jgi:mannan endo-1,4-beta-mannosidase
MAQSGSRTSDRRGFLRRVFAAGTVGLAGCVGDDGTPTDAGTSPPGGTPTDAGTPTGTPPAGTTPTSDPAVGRFVERDDADFVVDSNRVAVSGGNHPQVSLLDELATPDAWLDAWLEAVPGLDVLRVPAFGDGAPNRLQPTPGEYNEEAFELLDELVYRFGQRGVRLVFFLTNYWDWRGGMLQYVAWSDTADAREDFYTDERIQEWYRSYVEYVLERENTYTGVAYKDDPTILAWELANEPRAMDVDNGVLLDWIEDTAAFITGIDPNHLVSTGMEGFYAQSGNPEYPDDWRHDGSQAPGFIACHAVDDIDACSVHLYPDSWDMTHAAGADWIERHTRDAAEELGKPCYLGEFGVPVDRTDGVNDAEQLAVRNEAYASWYETMLEVGTDGAMVWDLRTPGEYPLGWNTHAVFPRDEGTVDLLRENTAVPDRGSD